MAKIEEKFAKMRETCSSFRGLSAFFRPVDVNGETTKQTCFALRQTTDSAQIVINLIEKYRSTKDTHAQAYDKEYKKVQNILDYIRLFYLENPLIIMREINDLSAIISNPKSKKTNEKSKYDSENSSRTLASNLTLKNGNEEAEKKKIKRKLDELSQPNNTSCMIGGLIELLNDEQTMTDSQSSHHAVEFFSAPADDENITNKIQELLANLGVKKSKYKKFYHEYKQTSELSDRMCRHCVKYDKRNPSDQKFFNFHCAN